MMDENPPKLTKNPVDFHGSFLEYCAERYPEANLIYPTGFEQAIIGVTDELGGEPALVMSTSIAIEIIQGDTGLSLQDALDHFYFNVRGSVYPGDQNPIWIDTVDDYARNIC